MCFIFLSDAENMAPSMDWNNMNPKIECVCAEIKRGSGTIFNIVFWQTIISPWTNERLNLNQLWRWGDGLRISFPWHCYSKGQCTLDLITLAFWALTLFRYYSCNCGFSCCFCYHISLSITYLLKPKMKAKSYALCEAAEYLKDEKVLEIEDTPAFRKQWYGGIFFRWASFCT